MNNQLHALFYDLSKTYSADNALIDRLWDGMAMAYENPRRHYHNFDHLRQVLRELEGVKDAIKNWPAVVFTLFYHDLVYRPYRLRDERKSAERAVSDLELLDVDQPTIELVSTMIRATARHEPATQKDINYFIDADLSIFGQAWDTYRQYSEKVRREFHLLPAWPYKQGRKRFLKRMLKRDPFYITGRFKREYEQQAQANIRKELSSII